MLIGITGKAGVGKDTVAEELWKKYAFTRIAFADPLKRAAQEIFGLTDAQVWSRDLKEEVIPYWNMSPRHIFQQLGTEAMQPVFGREVWVRRWQLSYDAVKHSDHVVVPDVRFDAEAALIRSLGGHVLRIERQMQSSLDTQAQAHVSESGISADLISAVIYNNSTVEDLHDSVFHILVERGLSA